MRLYVGNLPFQTTEDELREAFSAHGNVVDCKIIIDRETGRSRGFGFVEMEDGADAIEQMNGHDFGGRALVVNEARERQGGGGGGGGRGGFGGGGGGGRGGFGGGGGGGGRGGYGGGGGGGGRGGYEDRGGGW